MSLATVLSERRYRWASISFGHFLQGLGFSWQEYMLHFHFSPFHYITFTFHYRMPRFLSWNWMLPALFLLLPFARPGSQTLSISDVETYFHIFICHATRSQGENFPFVEFIESIFPRQRCCCSNTSCVSFELWKHSLYLFERLLAFEFLGISGLLLCFERNANNFLRDRGLLVFVFSGISGLSLCFERNVNNFLRDRGLLVFVFSGISGLWQ